MISCIFLHSVIPFFDLSVVYLDDNSRLYCRSLGKAVDSSQRLSPEGEVVSKEKFECTRSSLESELVELRERYSQMSLRYAEVEAQREELVMKLKAARSTRRWFS